MTDATGPDGRVARGARTRAEILTRAVDVATVHGLEGLTIGGLAGDLALSKSGLIRHFGSKEELQLAAVAAAGERFARVVLSEAAHREPGIARLEAVVAAWVDYLVGDTFPGGCFFYAAAPEVDRRPGRVRDAVVDAVRAGIGLLRADVVAAQAAGDLDVDADPDQVVFELHGQVLEASLWHLLLDDQRAADRSRHGVQAVIRRYSSDRRPAP